MALEPLDEPTADQRAASGCSEARMLEVVLGVAMKTLSNYTNHLTDTPIDPEFAVGP